MQSCQCDTVVPTGACARSRAVRFCSIFFAGRQNVSQVKSSLLRIFVALILNQIRHKHEGLEMKSCGNIRSLGVAIQLLEFASYLRPL
jgi:hypothetical protein